MFAHGLIDAERPCFAPNGAPSRVQILSWMICDDR